MDFCSELLINEAFFLLTTDVKTVVNVLMVLMISHVAVGMTSKECFVNAFKGTKMENSIVIIP